MKIKSTSIELWNEFLNELGTLGLKLPEFSGSEEIIIFSDYAGERSEDKYYSYSFFIVDKFESLQAVEKIVSLRNSEPEWGDTSFIEYKKLKKDNVRRRILPNFLNIFDQLDGLIITVLIDQNSPDYFLRVSMKEAELMDKYGFGAWPPQILRKSANILSILAFIVKRFLNDRATFIWYSDRDDIFGPNQSKKEKTLDMLTTFLDNYEINSNGRKFGFISDKHRIIDSDFMSVVDLSAGAVLDYYQTSYQGGEIKDWSKTIISWMSKNSTRLKKLMIIGEEKEGQKRLIALRNYG